MFMLYCLYKEDIHMPDIGLPELLVILVILLLLFGAKALPKLSRSIGDSVRELRHGLNGDKTAQDKSKKTQAGAKTRGDDKAA